MPLNQIVSIHMVTKVLAYMAMKMPDRTLIKAAEMVVAAEALTRTETITRININGRSRYLALLLLIYCSSCIYTLWVEGYLEICSQ